MFKKISFFIILSVFTFANSIVFAAGASDGIVKKSNDVKIDNYIKYVYNAIDFKGNKISYAAFSNGFYGFLNLVEAGQISQKSYLSICDFSLSSNKKRLWVIDVNKKKVIFNTLVAHGMGTGDVFATRFSNIHESHQSSLGFYLTAETYEGNNGFSLKLKGIDGNFNNNAYDRAIVIHGADYVSKSFAMGNQRIGRSHGCPALPRALNEPIINKIKNGHCFYIYHPTKTYFANSRWIKDPLKYLPKEAELLDLNPKIVAFNDKKIQSEDNEKDLKIDADDDINEKDLPKEVLETAKIENVIEDKPVFELSDAQLKNATIIKLSKEDVGKINTNCMTIYKSKVPEAPKPIINVKNIIQISNNGSQADTLKIK